MISAYPGPSPRPDWSDDRWHKKIGTRDKWRGINTRGGTLDE